MKLLEVVSQVSQLAARQWGLLTTAQAASEGISRLHLGRLAAAGVIERLDRGIYGIPAAVDERTPMRVAWLSLDAGRVAEERLVDPVAPGMGDLLGDEPELSVPGRKQSRRGIRLHRAALAADDVTLVSGLPVTTPARTVADLLRDGHEPSHVADIVGEAARRDLATPHELEVALEPLARRNGQTSGAALLGDLLDGAGLNFEWALLSSAAPAMSEINRYSLPPGADSTGISQ